MSEPHPFDEAIRLEPQAEGLWRGHTHEANGNMMGPFDRTVRELPAPARAADRGAVGRPHEDRLIPLTLPRRPAAPSDRIAHTHPFPRG